MVTITQPTLGLEIESIDFEEIDCNGGSTDVTVNVLGGTAPYNYVWNDSSIENDNTNIATVQAGEYSVTVTDANGCQTIKTVTIIEPLVLTVPEAGDNQNLNCGISSTTLNGNIITSGIGTWSINTENSDTGGSISNVNDPNSAFIGSAGTYTLNWTVTNENGDCEDVDSVTINISDDCINLDFDGVDDHIVFDDNYSFDTGNFSIEVWVKPESLSGIQTILSKRDLTNLTNGGFDLIINGGSPTFRWNGKTVTTSKKLTTSRWYHLAVIYNGTAATFYVDGLSMGSTTGSNPKIISEPFILGAMYDAANPLTPGNYYSGWMEELRLWKTSLSVDQLRFMMNQKIINNNSTVRGEIIDIDAPNNLSWNSLIGYYQLDPSQIINGKTP
ncbi:MAG TPA: LamG domain-containing protein, partial [Christiangramia sp.]|nr:LamG domain-containing protein [Christiangramia sp.]